MCDAAESTSGPRLSVILVSYNTRQMTIDCLGTLLQELGGNSAEVLLVDNASIDGTAAAVREAFPRVTVIESATNLGFGGGNNLAMQQAKGQYLLLINTDAFPRPGAIDALVDYLEKHPDVALVGPRLVNGDGSLQQSCYRYPTPARAWRVSSTTERPRAGSCP